MNPRRSTWSTSRFDGMETARATSIARSMSSRMTSRVWAVTATWPVEFWLSTCCPPTPTKARSIFEAREALGALDRVGDRADRLVDVDDHALLESRCRHRALADDRQPAVATDLADERATLLVPTSMPTRTASRSTVFVVPRYGFR